MITVTQENGLCTHASDTFLIQKVGTNEVYESATDLMPCPFDYIETDTPLPVREEPEQPTQEQITE